MANRKSTGKRLRFEIFKRDGFTCQYCGKQPPEAVLVVDHIMPVASGGDNDPLNLVTACEVCNQGKADKKLEHRIPRPDADLEWLESQQEIAELRRYQIAKQERDLLMIEVVAELQKYWHDQFGDWDTPDETEFRQWLSYATPDEVEYAIGVASSHAYKLRTRYQRTKYTVGVLLRTTGRMENERA